MAVGNGSMNNKPPSWLERALLLLLPEHDCETISGDLLEEYRDKLPALGAARACFWYLRQVISFIPVQLFGGSRLKQLLVCSCFFTAAAAVWLIIMENVLKHNGYVGRSAIAAGIALQSAATLLLLLLHGRAVFRFVVLGGAIAIALLGISAVFKTLQANHFEGFVLIIGSALLIQSGLTTATLLSRQAR